MASFNKVILMGNLTRDPELRYTPKGQATARLGLAVNRRYTTEAGEVRDEVTFIDIDAWAKKAEVIAQYCRKGSPLLIEGRLKLDQWDDKNTGQKMSKLRVVLEGFEFVGSKAQEAAAPGGPVPATPVAPRPAPSRPAAPKPAESAGSESEGPPPDDDDVPF